jgi:hypothetical protein
MSRSASPNTLAYLPNFTTRKVQALPDGLPADVPDSLAAWATHYLALAVVGVRSEAVTRKIALHLDRFVGFFVASYGHDRISTCLRRDVLTWQRALVDQGLAPATVNNHLARPATTSLTHACSQAWQTFCRCDGCFRCHLREIRLSQAVLPHGKAEWHLVPPPISARGECTQVSSNSWRGVVSMIESERTGR